MTPIFNEKQLKHQWKLYLETNRPTAAQVLLYHWLTNQDMIKGFNPRHRGVDDQPHNKFIAFDMADSLIRKAGIELKSYLDLTDQLKIIKQKQQGNTVKCSTHRIEMLIQSELKKKLNDLYSEMNRDLLRDARATNTPQMHKQIRQQLPSKEHIDLNDILGHMWTERLYIVEDNIRIQMSRKYNTIISVWKPFVGFLTFEDMLNLMEFYPKISTVREKMLTVNHN